MTSFAKARRIVSKRSPARREADRRERVSARRGERMAQALLDMKVIRPNYSYGRTMSTTAWTGSIYDGLDAAFRNDERWASLSFEEKNNIVGAAVRLLIHGWTDGDDEYDPFIRTTYELNYSSTAWKYKAQDMVDQAFKKIGGWPIRD